MPARIILLLGSDDLATRSILDKTKLAVATIFQAEDVYCFTEDQLEVFTDSSYDILVERYSDHDATIFAFDKRGNLVLLDDISVANYFDISEEVYEYLVNWATRTGEDIPSGLLEIRPFEKIQILSRISSKVFVVKNKDETNGEEIIGYVIGASKYSGKFRLFLNEKCEVGELLKSFTELHKVQITNFDDMRDLLSKIKSELIGI